jgi:hypothetical protein
LKAEQPIDLAHARQRKEVAGHIAELELSLGPPRQSTKREEHRQGAGVDPLPGRKAAVQRLTRHKGLGHQGLESLERLNAVG